MIQLLTVIFGEKLKEYGLEHTDISPEFLDQIDPNGFNLVYTITPEENKWKLEVMYKIIESQIPVKETLVIDSFFFVNGLSYLEDSLTTEVH